MRARRLLRPPGTISVLAAAFWMVLISLALFFVPAVNGLIAGLVGGYLVGDAVRGVFAALVPALVAAVGLWLLLIVAGMPFFGLVAGIATGGWIALSEIGLLLGAAIGGAVRGWRVAR